VRTAAGRRILWRWLAGVVVLFGVVALLGGCGVVSAMLDTQQGLRDAGYQSVHVGFHDNGSADDVDVSVTVSAEPTQNDTVNVASVVWAKLHERFDNLAVSVHGDGSSVSRRFTFDELQQTFGARNPSYNSTTVAGGVKRLGFEVLGGLAVLVIAIVLTAIFLTRRRRRNRQPAWPGWSPGPAPAGMAGQPLCPGGPPSPYAGGSGAFPPSAAAPPPPPSVAPAPPLSPYAAPAPPPPGWPLWPPPPHPPRPAEAAGPSPGDSPPPPPPPAGPATEHD
jgi:hypothetical protein